MTRLDISGVLVHTRADEMREMCLRLEAIDGVEIQASTDDGRIVVLIEAENSTSTADCFLQVQNLEGVLSAALVYHHNEELDPVEEEISS